MVDIRKPARSIKGLTLVEIIVAIAVLGIIIVSILNMFNFGITEIFSSGFRTDASHEVQQLADDLQAEHSADPFDLTELETFLNGRGYKKVDEAALKVKQAGYDGNYCVGSTTIANVKGAEITILKFYKNDERTVRITTYLIGDDLI